MGKKDPVGLRLWWAAAGSEARDDGRSQSLLKVKVIEWSKNTVYIFNS